MSVASSLVLAVHRAGAPLRLWRSQRAVPVRAVEGFSDLRRPALSSRGWMAVQCLARGTGRAWQGATLLLDDRAALVDVLPWALPTTAPAWAPDGARLARVVTDFSGCTAVEVTEAPTGRTRRLAEAADVTAVTWTTDDDVLLARGGSLERVPVGGGEPELVRRWPEAERFLRFGSDDYFATVDHLSIDGGRIVAEVAWHQQGRPATATVYDWTCERPERLSDLDGCRQPALNGASVVATCASGNLVELNEEGRRALVTPLRQVRFAALVEPARARDGHGPRPLSSTPMVDGVSQGVVGRASSG